MDLAPRGGFGGLTPQVYPNTITKDSNVNSAIRNFCVDGSPKIYVDCATGQGAALRKEHAGEVENDSSIRPIQLVQTWVDAQIVCMICALCTPGTHSDGLTASGCYMICQMHLSSLIDNTSQP